MGRRGLTRRGGSRGRKGGRGPRWRRGKGAVVVVVAAAEAPSFVGVGGGVGSVARRRRSSCRRRRLPLPCRPRPRSRRHQCCSPPPPLLPLLDLYREKEKKKTKTKEETRRRGRARRPSPRPAAPPARGGQQGGTGHFPTGEASEGHWRNHRIPACVCGPIGRHDTINLVARLDWPKQRPQAAANAQRSEVSHSHGKPPTSQFGSPSPG